MLSLGRPTFTGQTGVDWFHGGPLVLVERSVQCEGVPSFLVGGQEGLCYKMTSSCNREKGWNSREAFQVFS